jgi:hypothetical protein
MHSWRNASRIFRASSGSHSREARTPTLDQRVGIEVKPLGRKHVLEDLLVLTDRFSWTYVRGYSRTVELAPHYKQGEPEKPYE